MDLQKEREAFEELIDIEIIISEGFKFNPNINQYYHPDHTNHRLSYAYLMGAWMVWQEKAHEAEKLKGCMVVPVEPTAEMIEAGNLANECGSWPHEIYAVMIEAARGGK